MIWKGLNLGLSSQCHWVRIQLWQLGGSDCQFKSIFSFDHVHMYVFKYACRHAYMHMLFSSMYTYIYIYRYVIMDIIIDILYIMYIYIICMIHHDSHNSYG